MDLLGLRVTGNPSNDPPSLSSTLLRRSAAGLRPAAFPGSARGSKIVFLFLDRSSFSRPYPWLFSRVLDSIESLGSSLVVILVGSAPF